MAYGFCSLKVCPPYWSCEGHLFPNGKLNRVPQVWFYSRSLIYPKLIGDYVFNLHTNKKLNFQWHVCLAFSEDHLETGFKLQPDISTIDEPDLVRMQKDAQIIAGNLNDGVRDLAQQYLCETQAAN